MKTITDRSVCITKENTFSGMMPRMNKMGRMISEAHVAYNMCMYFSCWRLVSACSSPANIIWKVVQNCSLEDSVSRASFKLIVILVAADTSMRKSQTKMSHHSWLDISGFLSTSRRLNISDWDWRKRPILLFSTSSAINNS